MKKSEIIKTKRKEDLENNLTNSQAENKRLISQIDSLTIQLERIEQEKEKNEKIYLRKAIKAERERVKLAQRLKKIRAFVKTIQQDNQLLVEEIAELKQDKIDLQSKSRQLEIEKTTYQEQKQQEKEWADNLQRQIDNHNCPLSDNSELENIKQQLIIKDQKITEL